MFGGFEDPFSIRFFENTLPKIKNEYIDTGKVRFVYQEYVLQFHPNEKKW